MRRVNTFEVRPLRERDELLLLEILDASASLWNELTYERRHAFFAGEDIWNGDSDHYRSKYKGTIGAAGVQQIIRRNDALWRGFFALLEEGANANPPGYWKTDGQRRLRTLVRNDQYTLEWGERSRLEIPVGLDLKEKYGLGYNERLRLEARGNPRWTGKQGRLGLVYDRDAESFRARQPVKNATRRRESLAPVSSDDDTVAALDIGANNLVAVTTTRGNQRLYHGRPSFRRFHRTTERIATLQSRLESGTESSRRIRRLYQQRSDRRNHLQDALVRDLVSWLRDRGVSDVIVGDLGPLSPHWCARVNEKVHLFWAYGRFQRRLREVLQEEHGITVREVDERGSSSQCPRCRGREVNRSGDAFRCHECGFVGHSDIVGSENLLFEYTDCGSMARPVAPDQNRSGGGHREVPRLEWNDHRWQRRDRSTKEDPTNRSTRTGKLAAGETGPS